MPSQLHESHLFLFRNQPALAADLIRGALGVELPAYDQARIAAAGVAEGEARGRAAMVVRLLTRRFGKLDATVETRIQRASIADLESMGERLLSAATLEEALGS